MRAMGQRSWRKGTPLEWLELDAPRLGDDDVRVRVQAVGVNPVDWKMREMGPLRLAARVVGPPLPFVPGVDFAGVVEMLGVKVHTVAVGDRVVGGTDFSRGQRGSYADTVVVRADQICRLPDGVSCDTAAALPIPGVTAHRALFEIGGLEAGASVLVLGAAGGVGQLAVQLARSAGARVVGVCSARNHELVRDLGAELTIDYAASDPLQAAQKAAPYQVVVDCVGYPGAACRALLTRKGRHVMVAADGASMLAQSLLPPFRSRPILGRSNALRLRPLVEAVAAGTLRVHIVERLPLGDAERAHTLSKTRHTAGKILLLP